MSRKLTIFFFLYCAIFTLSNACQPPAVCPPQYQLQSQQIQPPYLTIPQVNSFSYPSTSTQILNCIFTSDPGTSTYDCSSTNTTIKYEGTGFSSLEGSHTSNHSNYDVNGLKISSQICHFVPENLSQLMPRLKKLEITYSSLLAIDERDTSKLPELQFLNLKGNRITELSFRLFQFNTELVSIDFSDNFIKAVAEDLLAPFDHMRFVNFGNNLCVKNEPAGENFREWDRELRRNCNPVEKYAGVSEPLWKIADYLSRNDGYSG